MDAKMRANFINSVAAGQKIPCPSCNKLNNANSSFCMACGTRLAVPVTEKKETPTFNAVKETVTPALASVKPVSEVAKKPAFKFVEPKIEEDDEPASVFAQGLPSWDIVPPQVVVRRKAKR